MVRQMAHYHRPRDSASRELGTLDTWMGPRQATYKERDMAQQTSSVSQASVLRQAVENTSSSLELLREAVSNSVDAGAQMIAIDLHNIGGDVWNIVIED